MCSLKHTKLHYELETGERRGTDVLMPAQISGICFYPFLSSKLTMEENDTDVFTETTLAH